MTGAEHRLDTNTNGVWASSESIYVFYDSNTARLQFTDGSFWAMGSVAAGTEQDAGTRYPTLMQDSNGNQTLVRYHPGVGITWSNSSARIRQIEDVRAVPDYWTQEYRTYQFSYDQDPIPHLSAVTNTIGTSEGYTFGYLDNQTLTSPISPYPQFGTTSLLQSVTISGLNLTHTLEYGSNNAGELTTVTLPYGGYLRWLYRDFTFSQSRTQREVQTRILAPSSGASELSYGFTHDSDAADAALSLHRLTTLTDPTVAKKLWTFNADPGAWNQTLLAAFEEQNATGQSPAVLQRQELTWQTNSSGNPYVSRVLTTLHPGAAYQKQMKTEQTVDASGNTTETKVYDYGNLTTPARTYTHTYLSGSAYSSRYIRNRLLTSSVTAGGQTLTLVSNQYDGWGLTDRTGLRQHDSANYGQWFTTRGNVISTTQPGGITQFAYDITGTLVRSTDPGGYQVDVTPATGRNNAVPGTLTPNSNANLAESFTYTGFLGVASSTAPNSSTTQMAYDAYARLSSTTSSYGATTTYSYATSPPTQTATTNGRWVKSYNDGLGRTIKVETGDGSGTKSTVETEYAACACSPLGKVSRVSQPYAPGGTKYWTAYTFDGLGRTLSVTHPDNTGTTGYLYEGNTVKVTDPAGKWKKFLYDAFGNLTKVTEPNPAGGADHETNYTYNLVNKLTQVSMPRGSVTQTRSFTYAFTTQRLTSTANPENGTLSYTYNSDGTVASKTKADGLRIEYSYDSFRRVTQVRKYNSLSLEEMSQREDFYYDTNPLDPSFTQNGWGRLTAATVGGVQSGPSCPSWFGDSVSMCFSTLYSYTAAGRATQKRLLVTKNLGTPGSPVWDSRYLDAGFTYDNEGRRTSATYPGTWTTVFPPYVYSPGPTYNYTYDSMGRLNGMWEQQGQQYNWVQDVLYGPSGEMTQMRYANHKYLETRQYNVRGQMTRLKVRDEQLSQWSEDIEYRFSATQNNGRITQSKDWVSGEEVTYQYDSLTRLIAAATTSSNWGLSFTYDGFGNRTAQTVTKGSAPTSSVVVDGNTNRITSSGWLYDGNGNATRMPGFYSLSYDLSNRLASASPSSGGTEDYAYEATNQRVWRKKADGTEEVYFNSPEGEKLRTYRVSVQGSEFTLQLTSASLYFGGKLIWEDGAVVSDRLGSRVKHFPYGEEIQPSPDGVTKFATYYRDSTTALDYAQNRYYSSTQARFLTPDPYVASAAVENPQSWNRYAYVENDPVNRVDPSGLYGCSVEYGMPCFSVTMTQLDSFRLWGGSLGPGVGSETRPKWQNEANRDLRAALLEAEAAQRRSDEEIARGYLSNAISLIKNAILTRKECAELFRGNIQPWEVLEAMATGKAFGAIKFRQLRGIDGQVRADESTAIFSDGTWFYLRVDLVINSSPGGTKYWSGNGSTDVDRARYLLHELGHVYNMVLGLGGSAFKLDVNPDNTPDMGAQRFNQELEKKCFP